MKTKILAALVVALLFSGCYRFNSLENGIMMVHTDLCDERSVNYRQDAKLEALRDRVAALEAKIGKPNQAQIESATETK